MNFDKIEIVAQQKEESTQQLSQQLSRIKSEKNVHWILPKFEKWMMVEYPGEQYIADQNQFIAVMSLFLRIPFLIFFMIAYGAGDIFSLMGATGLGRKYFFYLCPILIQMLHSWWTQYKNYKNGSK